MIKTHKPYYPLYEDKEHFIYLITGGRGCERPTQEVMMADLSVKQIKDIKIGDKVMGDDGTPRTVINTYHGFGKMYEVWQSNGETYYVNDGHILTLFHIGRCKKVDIPIIEYIGLSEWEKRMMRGCNVSHELSLIEVKQIENGEWCGIHLDGNQRYVHSDGTVTHNSGKSFSAGTFIERLTFEYNKEKGISHQILFTRYTMASAGMSIIPEFLEKVELDGTDAYFHKANNDVVNTMTKSRVMFRGINTSSGNQTAKLKSIQGVTTFIVDEAEEWLNEEEFERIMLSIRTKGLQNRVIIIMNPADSNHWVYKRFIRDTHKIVEYDGVPVQISTHPNVLHVHTSYLDNIEHLSEQFLKEILDMKVKNPQRYAHIVMGQWADVAEGAVFKKWGIVDEFPKYAKKIARAMDFGYTCFRGDTLITTKRGEIPIKDIKVGDYVLTRKGYRRVRNKMYNGVKNVLTKEILINGTKHTLSATYEHNINVNGKWKKYGELTKKDKLFVLSNTRALNTEDTLTANTQITTITDGRVRGSIIKNSCTMLSIGITLEKFRKVRSFITKILTRSITTPQTLLQSHHQSTTLFICQKKTEEKNRQSTQRQLVSRKVIGTNEERRLIITLQTLLRSVSSVVKSLFQPMFTKDSVQNTVITNGNILHQKTTQNLSVNVAEKPSWEISTADQSLAVKNVLISSHGIEAITTLGEEKCDVYDLEIEGIHEYFANGILVHNCDPTAIVRCGIVDNRLYLDELCYKTGMTSGDIIRELRQEAERGDDGFVYAESADPRLIDEITLGGVIIYPVVKSAGSILAGLAKMLDMEIYVTKRSVNLQEELRNYIYAKDRFGNYTNMPEDHHNHCFTADTLVTTDKGRKPIASLLIGDKVLTSVGYRDVVDFFNNGVKEVWERTIRTIRKDIQIKATPDHKFKTPNGWVQYKDLEVGSILYIDTKDGIVECPILDIIEYRRFDAEVFDITVDEIHEFLANDILVSNCIDASRYYILGNIEGKILHPKRVTKADLGVY